METVFDTVILAAQLSAAGVGVVLYLASFLGYGYETGAPFLGASFLGIFLANLPGLVRDRRFFRKHWGIGMREARRKYFPFQMFPARSEGWLNPLGWAAFALLLLHFLLLMVASVTSTDRIPNWEADLGYPSLMFAAGGFLSASAWIYPPTLRREDVQ